MTPKIYITYDMIFTDKPKEISEYLRVLDREWLIKFSLLLIQTGDKYERIADYASMFFCKDNSSFINHVLTILQRRITPNPKDITQIIPRSYFIISEGTGLELLKHTFALNSHTQNVPQVIQEQYLFKAILLINSKISHWVVPEDSKEDGSYTDLYYAKSFMSMFINNYERTHLKPEIIITFQFIKGYFFFKYCEKSKLKEHLKLFLEKNGVSSWQMYLYNIIKLILFPLKNRDTITTIHLNENEKDNGYTFLHSHSFPIEKIIDLDDNVDYTYFKSNPLIEVNRNTFMPISTMFCVNQLYKSIYFEFRAVNKLLEGTEHYLAGRGLITTLTTEFSEQFLFNMIIRKVLSLKRGIKLSDNDCKVIKKTGQEPDFYFRDGNNIFLFENKDIMINAQVKESGNYESIDEFLNKKLINHSGIPQLINNIVKIASKEFIWDSKLPNNPRIYPILVLGDSSLCVPGLNYVLNDAFQKQLRAKNIKIKVYPLVVIELDTLIAFLRDFERGSVQLKSTIEQYYAYLTRCREHVSPEDILEEVFHRFFSFYIFLSGELLQKPFDDTLFDEICDELRQAIKVGRVS